ncbi:hypothetical protein KIN20_010454 [Parelaphostrongylus tenuis]|uniref:Uncharacterized protein n=1 Tax=Parelaphostrongylus tenuis TaxID=148309 RepID=A0AAD5MU38_PARTN|nr:hypothetical protein KIN20_010454 [Parelaphostrongylus tenuis]
MGEEATHGNNIRIIWRPNVPASNELEKALDKWKSLSGRNPQQPSHAEAQIRRRQSLVYSRALVHFEYLLLITVSVGLTSVLMKINDVFSVAQMFPQAIMEVSK